MIWERHQKTDNFSRFRLVNLPLFTFRKWNLIREQLVMELNYFHKDSWSFTGSKRSKTDENDLLLWALFSYLFRKVQKLNRSNITNLNFCLQNTKTQELNLIRKSFVMTGFRWILSAGHPCTCTHSSLNQWFSKFYFFHLIICHSKSILKKNSKTTSCEIVRLRQLEPKNRISALKQRILCDIL